VSRLGHNLPAVLACALLPSCIPSGSGCDAPAAACPTDDSTTATDSSTSSAATTAMSATASTNTASTATTSDDADSSTTEPVVCNGAALRVASFNVKSVGFEDSDEWDALGSVLARLSPDVICIEEFGDGETAPLRALTTALGWGEPIQAESSPAIGGELRSACMGPHPMARIDSYGSELSGDPDANDVGRDFLGVRLVQDGCPVNVLAVHAKSGQEDVDFFRRQVEFIRLGQAIEDVHTTHPGEPLVVMGDFNENTDDAGIGTVFDAAPPGLPPSYSLGSDIAFPITYDPFATIAATGLTRLEPTHEDSPRIGTWNVSAAADGIRIDYVWLDGPEPVGAIVFDACRDDGVDEPPAGQFLPMAGDPVPCVASELASDHLPVVADLMLAP
jgi:endonuclease/exonuclease/phosphatase family metal-dependent hydrolase